MKNYFFYAAIIGWLLSLTAHLFSIFDIDIAAKIPYIWILHVGIFIVCIPAIIELVKYRIENGFQNDAKANRRKAFSVLKTFIKTTPLWLIIIAFGGLIYATINFMFFMGSQNGTPEFSEGQYYLQSHDSFIRNITEQEYYHFQANVLRGFSGHWIAFYGFAVAVLFPFNKDGNSKIID